MCRWKGSIMFSDKSHRRTTLCIPPCGLNGVNLHARYYGVITLNWIMLSSSPEDRAISKLPVDLNFRLFHEILHEWAHRETHCQTRCDTGEGEDDAGEDAGKDDNPT